MGPVTVELTVDQQPEARPVHASSRSCRRPAAASAPAALVLPSGERHRRSATSRHHDRPPARMRRSPLNDPTSAAATPRSGPAAPASSLVDLGSTNGTKVNGMRIEGEHLLHDGDIISVGATHIRFEASAEGVARRPHARPRSSASSSSCLLVAAVPLLRPRAVGGVERGPRATAPADGPPPARRDRRPRRPSVRRADAPAAQAPRRRRRRRASAAMSAGSSSSSRRRRKGTAFALGDEITIGRAAGCTISLPDDTLRVAAPRPRLQRTTGQVYVEDLGSTNGTYLNGNRARRADGASQGRPAAGRQHRPGGRMTVAALMATLRWGAATDTGPSATANEDSVRRGAACSPSPTAWAATTPARSPARSRSRADASASASTRTLTDVATIVDAVRDGQRDDPRAPQRTTRPPRHGHHAHRPRRRRLETAASGSCS